MIELLTYSKYRDKKDENKIIKDYSNKARICGYIDGWNFLTKKKKLYGLIEKNNDGQFITKLKWGTAGIKLHLNGEIFLTAKTIEKLGYLKDYKIFYPNGELSVEYLPDTMEIQRYDKTDRGNVVRIDVIKIQGDVNEFNEAIFLGIASFYLDFFA